jgi:hypothetical protein
VNRCERVRVAAAVELQAEQRRARDVGDAVGAASQVRPVDQHDADDLAERQGDDGEVVATQPQHREAEDDAPQRRQQAGDRQRGPETQVEGGGQQRVRVGADRVERDVAEVEQAGQPDHDGQAPAEHHVGEHQDAGIERVATAVQRQGQRQDQEHRPHQLAGAGQALGQQARRGRAGRAPQPPGQHQDAPGEYRAHHRGQHPRPGFQLQAGVGRHQMQPDQRDEQAKRHQRRQYGVAQDAGGGEGLAAHTFSMSARPSRPEGMKISTITSTENAATFLYSTLA